MVEETIKSNCTGCKMCADICPKNAITFTTNSEGYWYPKVDKNKCIKCGLCLKKCPVSEQNSKKFETLGKAYSAWSTNDEIRRESTSGGLYYEFASYVLNHGGYIVGSRYSDDFCSAYHTYSDSFDGLKKIMGSKYFQSDTAGIYIKTKELLQTNKLVLFTGTPCQVAALKSFLGKEYENLITIDFICRGVPSPLLQKKKIELYQKQTKSQVTYYRDKSKYYAWSDFGELIKFKNGKQRFISRWKDDINDCFIHKNLNLRESCYKCNFKNGNNASDITIGDFWEIKNMTRKDTKYGISAMIVNTERGLKFIDCLDKKIYKKMQDIEKIKKGNPAYVSSVKRPENRNAFFESVLNKGLEKSVKKFSDQGLKKKLYSIKNIIKGKIKYKIPINLKSFFKLNLRTIYKI